MDRTTITFLGTTTVVPAAGQDTASLLINGRYLVDTGWYAPLKMKSYGFDPMELDSLFLTHCHHDHYLALPPLLFYLRMRRHERPERPPLKIVGPAADLQRVVDLARQFLQPERFPDVEIRPELYPLTPGESFEDEAFHLATCSTRHPVQGLCYRFTDRRTGASVVFTGDTAYHPPIAELARGADLLIHEASHGPHSPPRDNPAGHSGAPDAAEVARLAGAERLALIHVPEDQAEAAVSAAQKLFPPTFHPAEGETVELGG